MKYRKLGNTSFSVSELGLGTAQLSNTDNQNKRVKFVPIEEALKIISVYIEGGINFFDTGAHYGNSELLFKGLKQKYRDKIIIATKAGMGDDGVRNLSLPSLREQIENSLKRMAVECLDLLQISKPTIEDLEDGRLFEFLDKLKKEGKIQFSGVVVGETKTGFQCIESGKVDCLQIMYNLLHQETEELIRQAYQKNLGVIIRSPLNNGLLSGTYTAHQTFDPTDERAEYFSGPRFAQRLKILHKIQEKLEIPNEKLIEYSLRFILSNPNISTVIPGASQIGQAEKYINIEENVSPFKPSELLKIKKTVSENMSGHSFSSKD
jgi:aryl-alcohol dehydrogenase-like predicted oxidoreductase